MDEQYLELSGFDFKVYGKHEDLRSMSRDELVRHFFEFGIAEGRQYSRIGGRPEFIASFDKSGKILEIGPLSKPLMDPNHPNYYSLDVFTKEELHKNYEHDSSVDKSTIVAPDYVIQNNDYSVIKEKFSSVLSSHNIEHMPCLVTFLLNLQGVLEDDGTIYLMIPDKRYCFDHFRRTSDIYDILRLYFERNYRPGIMEVLTHYTYSTHNNSGEHWAGEHGDNDGVNRVLQNYKGLIDSYNTGNYIDAHVSTFTPESFVGIVGMLGELELINLKIHRIYHTVHPSHEFFAELKKR